MNHQLPERVKREISVFAMQNDIDKIILFGSRARGTNTERSDVDLIAYGGNFDAFYWDIKEKIHSLLTFDLIDGGSKISEELQNEISRDGVTIYEKTR